MNKWISNQRSDYTVAARYYQIDAETFSEKQQLAYDLIVNHHGRPIAKEQLLLHIIGEGGTGKSYLINAIRN